jgi:two-component system, cell cycle sensor histidine kinase and response regulator CckA
MDGSESGTAGGVERQRAQLLLQAVVDSVLDGIISIDASGIVQAFNRAAETIFGYTAAEVVGRNVKMLMPEPYHGEHDGYLDNYPQTRTAKVIGVGREVAGRRKDGSTFPMDLAVTECVLGDTRHFTGIVRDITQRKKREEQLRQAQKMEAIGQLAGGVAHDFNNLLTIIAGYSSMLLSVLPVEDPSRVPVGEIRLAAERATALTRQLLTFSRKHVIAPRALNLNEVVSSAEQLLRRLIGENIIVSTALAQGVSQVRADPVQIEQVIVNLAINARDAMREGGRLTIETCDVELTKVKDADCAPGRYVMLAMTDTGCGMTPDVKARLFEPFFTTKGPGKGAGLGLATAYGIIKQSGGQIVVHSEPGIGSCFKVYLPAIAPWTQQAGAGDPARAEHGHETILLVEDEAGVRKLARLVLESHGYQVIEANSGAQAIEVVNSRNGPIHLVVTDVVMPQTSGSQLAQHLRGSHPDTKVLFMSGYTDDAVVRRGIIEAHTAFLQKPFTPHALIQKVRDVLDGRWDRPVS